MRFSSFTNFYNSRVQRPFTQKFATISCKIRTSIKVLESLMRLFFLFICFVLVIIDNWKSEMFLEVNQLIGLKDLVLLFIVLPGHRKIFKQIKKIH